MERCDAPTAHETKTKCCPTENGSLSAAMGRGTTRRNTYFTYLTVMYQTDHANQYRRNDKGDPASNVSRLSSAFARSCCSGMPQVIYYHPGAGTETSRTAKILGATLGNDVPQDIAESYRFICNNHRAEDELVFIGFSRGAFTARSVAGMVCALGFLNRAGIDQLPHVFRDYCNWSSWRDKSKFCEKVHLVGFTLENLEKNRKRYARVYDESRRPWGGDKEGMKAGLLEEKRELFGMIVDINLAKGSDAKVKVAEAYWGKLAEVGLFSPIYLLYAHLMLIPPQHRMLITHKAKTKRSMISRGASDPHIEEHTKNGADDASKSNKPQTVEDSRDSADPIVGKVLAIGQSIYHSPPTTTLTLSSPPGVWDTVGSLGIPKTPLSRNKTRRTQEVRSNLRKPPFHQHKPILTPIRFNSKA